MVTNVLDLLEATESKYPDKISFLDNRSEISFSGLVTEAKRYGSFIANYLKNKTNNPIVVLVDRNVETIVSFFSILYSGNFYVPIDNKSPIERLNIIFENLAPVAVFIFSSEEKELLEKISYEGLVINFYDEVVNKFSIDENMLQSIRKKMIDIDPVYSIYTSGSTGIPKGVIISHRGVIDLSSWLETSFAFTDKDSLGNQTPFYFDGSVKDIYITVRTGATTNIIAKKYFSFPKLLIQFLNEKKVTSILWATSAVNLIANNNSLEENKLFTVKKVFFAGEVMFGKQLNYWIRHLKDAKFVNLYGPTEVTVDCSFYSVERDFLDHEPIPIGNSCKNKDLLILNEKNEMVQIDQIGELCVRGTGLALGYYNNAEKTNEVFVQNPLNKRFNDLIYRTGDLVKLNSFNEILFISRKDFQIKHMGNRIELGEIESVINSLDDIHYNACIYDEVNEKIILFYNTHSESELNIQLLLKDKLPKYMFPNTTIYIKEMPFNRNDKIDRIKLKSLV